MKNSPIITAAAPFLVTIQLLLPILLGVLLATCSSSTTPDSPVILVVSGDTDGWITPCGCTANQSGGLPRRGTFLKQQRALATVLYADAGGAPAGTSDYQKLRFEAVLAGERAMNIVAHNIGGPEAALGPPYLRDLLSRTRTPLISANLRDAAGNSILPPIVVVPVGSRRFAFIGVLSPRYATAEAKITDPLTAVRDAVAAHKTEFDALIVLAYLPDDELVQLAAALPEADAVIGGPTGQSIAPRLTGPTILAAATRKGKFLVQLNMPPRSAGPWSGRIIELTPTYAGDPDQTRNFDNYLTALKQADFISTDTGIVPALISAPGFRIAGSASCLQCHANDAHIWEQSAHAHGWNSLTAKHSEVDPSCQQCHTTGYALPGGFLSASHAPSNVGIGCENCHGPSQAHVSNPALHTPYQAADQCIRCHDPENSPTYAFAAYWPKIAHGKSPATRP